MSIFDLGFLGGTGVRRCYHSSPEELAAASRDWRDCERVEVDPDLGDPTLISSACFDGLHRPVLDIDFDARLVPSSTPGHFHLYLDGLALDWERYERLLEALTAAGVIGEGNLHWAKVRGETLVRLPHVRKLKDETPSGGEPKRIGLYEQ